MSVIETIDRNRRVSKEARLSIDNQKHDAKPKRGKMFRRAKTKKFKKSALNSEALSRKKKTALL